MARTVNFKEILVLQMYAKMMAFALKKPTRQKNAFANVYLQNYSYFETNYEIIMVYLYKN
jgi:hypothetical protein